MAACEWYVCVRAPYRVARTVKASIAYMKRARYTYKV